MEYITISKNVLEDKEINFRAKVLFGYICSLTKKEGYCWATNAHFAEFLGADERSIRRDIKQLKDKGYLKVKMVYEEDGKKVEKREIRVDKSDHGGRTKLS